MTMNSGCRDIRKSILRASYRGQDGNLQSCFSSLEIIWTLYHDVMRISPDTARQPGHDRFVLSKGQANLALMCVLAHEGYLDSGELDTFGRFDSRISLQGDRTKFDGLLENSAGSLGHGFPIAAGLAWAARIKGTDERVFVLAGDGEMNEGTMWEAALFAASEGLDNLTLIIDDNDSIGRMLKMGDIGQKLHSFGFSVSGVDGHDEDALASALRKTAPGQPTAVIAKTVRGYGSDTLMRDRSWFHRAPKDDAEYSQLCAEVDRFEKSDAIRCAAGDRQP